MGVAIENQKTRFTARKHGFRFANRFQTRLPVSFRLPYGGEVDLNQVVVGLAGGMAFTALDYFHAGQAPAEAEQIDQIESDLMVYLCDRQLDSLSLPVVLRFVEWMMLEPSALAQKMTRSEIPKLQRRLAKGEPAALGLVRAHGVAAGVQNHIAVAVGSRSDPSSSALEIDLYDPNHPGETPVIRVHTAGSQAGWQLTRSTGEPLWGFFVLPYQAREVLPGAKQISFKVTAPAFGLHWPVDSRRVNQYFGENPASYKPFGLPGHEGLDLYALSGANIYACASGEVVQSGWPKNHPYGRHVRIQHTLNGKKVQTIYGHLSETLVVAGQKVSAGERIGLADNTGNSFGSHLHLTLKIDGEKTAGYPSGIVDPWPYLQVQPSPEPDEEPLPPASGVKIFTTASLNLRAGPSTEARILGLLPAGEELEVLGDAETARARIGKTGEWLQVVAGGGRSGFVAAHFVQDSESAFPPSDLVIYPLDEVNLRSGPGTGFDLLEILIFSDALTVLGDAGIARTKIGREGEWLQVQTGRGMRGFVAAWLVHLTGQQVPASELTVYPVDALNVRARPSTDANILTVVTPQDALVVVGDAAAARAKLGVQDEWLNVRTPSKHQGYVAAWLVSGQPGGKPETLTVFAVEELNLRAQATTNSPRVGGIRKGEPLRVIETDLAGVRAKVGQPEQWIFGENARGERGWGAAWYLQQTPL